MSRHLGIVTIVTTPCMDEKPVVIESGGGQCSWLSLSQTLLLAQDILHLVRREREAAGAVDFTDTMTVCVDYIVKDLTVSEALEFTKELCVLGRDISLKIRNEAADGGTAP